jgi:hypothetical protein
MGAVRAKSKKTRSGPGSRWCSKATSPSKSSVRRIVSPMAVRRTPRSVASRPVDSVAREALAAVAAVSTGIGTDSAAGEGAGGGVERGAGRAATGAVAAATGAGVVATGDAFAGAALANAGEGACRRISARASPTSELDG